MCSLFLVLSQLQFMPKQEYRLSRKKTENQCLTIWEVPVDMVSNSTMLVREQKNTGRTETQSFKIQKSKALIDKIDVALAEYYGFTDEELDHIINYDIKYRMGQGAGEHDDD